MKSKAGQTKIVNPEKIIKAMKADPRKAFSMIKTSDQMLIFYTITSNVQFTKSQQRSLRSRQKRISTGEIRRANSFDDLIIARDISPVMSKRFEMFIWRKLIRLAKHSRQAKFIYGHEKFPKELEPRLIRKWKELLTKDILALEDDISGSLLGTLTDSVDPQLSETHVNVGRERRDWG